MENKQNTYITNLLIGLAGLLVGFLIWGTNVRGTPMMSSNQGMHMMPNGTIMGNNGIGFSRSVHNV